MRTIKFRGKRISGGQWVYGNSLIQWYSGVAISDNIAESKLTNNNAIMVVASTIGQFTGLYDRNGKEIYEGDKLFIVEGQRAYTAYVMWDSDTAKFGLDYGLGMGINPKPLGEWIRDCKCEILGNIHDNPEWGKDLNIKTISNGK